MKEKEAYQIIIKEIEQRGFGIPLIWNNLGAIEPGEPSWTDVMLAGDTYTVLLLQINPKSIPSDVAEERFVNLDAENITPQVIKQSIQKYIPKLYPELTKFPLYTLNSGEITTADEYISDIEETLQKHYHKNLKEYLADKKPINFPTIT